jgi:hypothetical protein
MIDDDDDNDSCCSKGSVMERYERTKKKAFFGRLRIFMVRRHSNKQEVSEKDVCVHNITISADPTTQAGKNR